MPDPSARILVVDDTPENIDIIRETLKGDYRLRVAKDGPTALNIVARHPPDLILLDIMMPGMDGHEVYRRLQRLPGGDEIPVIFVTALADEHNESLGLGMGAADYIGKPIVPAVLRARVRSQLALLEARRALRAHNERLEWERELIEETVSRMRQDRDFDPRHLRMETLSPDRISGDLVLSSFGPDGGQYVLLADFTGHGLPAALGAPLVVQMFYSLSRRGEALAAILEAINEEMVRRFPTHLFMAAAAVGVDPGRRRVQLYNFGQPPILWWEDGETHRLPSQHPPLGITTLGFPSAGWRSLAPSTRLYLFTDGLYETPDCAGEPFGMARLEALLQALADDEQTPAGVLGTVRGHACRDHILDDMTLVEISL